MKDLIQQELVGTALSYLTTINSINKFRPAMRITNVNVKFLNDYENWMLTKGRTLTTVGFNLHNVRVIINKAIQDKYFDANHYPLGRNKYVIPSGTKTQRSLNLEDVKKIFEYKPHERMSFEDRSLDFWKFTYLCNGINMADIARLKWNDVLSDRILFKRTKILRSSRSSSTEITIIRNYFIDEIISKWANRETCKSAYLFSIIKDSDTPLLAKNNTKQFIRVTNEWMKKIGENFGFEIPVTTYVARHTFSTILLRSGASVEFISESLGHTDIKTTQHYLGGFDLETKKETMKALIDF